MNKKTQEKIQRERIIEILSKYDATLVDFFCDIDNFGNSILTFLDCNGKAHRLENERGEVFEGKITLIGAFESTPDGSSNMNDKLLYGIELCLKNVSI